MNNEGILPTLTNFCSQGSGIYFMGEDAMRMAFWQSSEDGHAVTMEDEDEYDINNPLGRVIAFPTGRAVEPQTIYTRILRKDAEDMDSPVWSERFLVAPQKSCRCNPYVIRDGDFLSYY